MVQRLIRAKSGTEIAYFAGKSGTEKGYGAGRYHGDCAHVTGSASPGTSSLRYPPTRTPHSTIRSLRTTHCIALYAISVPRIA
eukprot:2784321-Rhodomonas_salina.2